MHNSTASHLQAKKIKLAYLVSHPIQYQAPLLRRIAAQEDIDLTVFFQSDISTRAYHDTGFGRKIEWDVPLLDGYRHEFLPAIGGRDVITTSKPYSYGLARRLRAGGFDALWIHGYARPANWAAIIAARRLSIPVLVRDEAHSISSQRGAAKKILKRAFFTALSKFAFGFLAIGKLNKQYYRKNGIPEARIFSVPYCVDNEWFAAKAREASGRREALRLELGLSPDRQIILYASKLQRRKRPDDLLAAFKRLIAERDKDRIPYLLYVGDGEMKASLQSEAETSIREHVRFLGFRNQSELPALFDLCDVFVLPSEREPWGLIVNEVMNAGRPVIVSADVGCGPDLVHDGVNGYRFRTGDVDDLARGLSLTLRDPETCRAMGTESLKIISRWGFSEDIAGLRLALDAAIAQRR